MCINEVQQIQENKKILNNAQPLWHIILLSIFSLNLYQFYWYYKHFKILKEFNNKNTNPIIRSILLLIPIINCIVIYNFYKQILKFIKSNNINFKPESPTDWFLAYFSCTIVTFVATLYKWPILDYFHLLNFIPIVALQYLLNKVWKNKEMNENVRINFNLHEKSIIFIGGFSIVLIVIGKFF